MGVERHQAKVRKLTPLPAALLTGNVMVVQALAAAAWVEPKPVARVLRSLSWVACHHWMLAATGVQKSMYHEVHWPSGWGTIGKASDAALAFDRTSIDQVPSVARTLEGNVRT